MKRLLLLTPVLLAAAMSAQVPVRPATPSVPFQPLMPTEPLWSMYVPSPSIISNLDIANTVTSSLNFDWAPMSTAFNNLSYTFSDLPGHNGLVGWQSGGPVAWAQSDPADSLYRQARDQFNRGDYRRAADLFKSLPQKYSNSVYVADAQYYQAFSLYRIGGTPELQEALAVLEARKPVGEERPRNGAVSLASNAVSVYSTSDRLSYGFGQGGRNNDAAGLAARIAAVLSSRGMGGDAAVKRALAAGGDACNQDDQAVKAEALSALMQNDAEEGRKAASRILANKDECSVPLRRNAVMLVGNKHDDAATPTLVAVAKADPSTSVRMAAVDYLVRLQSDAAINAVVDVARTDTSKQIQRSAMRALAQSTNARARSEIRSMVESSTADESVRLSIIDGLTSDRMTAEDAAWLRSLYAKTTSSRVKERIVSGLARTGGEANNQWLLALVRNDDESLESRTTALERVGRTMDVATLVKMYDASAQRPIRRSVIDLLAERKEAPALDKIVEVAKSGTDVEMRKHAIYVLSRSKDPRASSALLSLVDH